MENKEIEIESRGAELFEREAGCAESCEPWASEAEEFDRWKWRFFRKLVAKMDPSLQRLVRDGEPSPYADRVFYRLERVAADAARFMMGL